MNRNVIETVLGAVVLLTAAVFLTFAYGSSDLGKKGGYMVKADFERVDGLKPGTDVKMNGVQIGSVESVVLNKQSYRATVAFTVDRAIKLPRDSIAMIASESLLGGKYLSLEVGMDEENVATDGSGKLTRTTPPLRLDDLIGHLIFNKSQDEKKDDNKATPATPSPSTSLPQPKTESKLEAPVHQKDAALQAAPPPSQPVAAEPAE